LLVERQKLLFSMLATEVQERNRTHRCSACGVRSDRQGSV
jgi:hypothetical protein